MGSANPDEEATSLFYLLQDDTGCICLAQLDVMAGAVNFHVKLLLTAFCVINMELHRAFRDFR